MADVVKKLGWDYVTLISSNGLSGDHTATMLIKKLKDSKISYSEHTMLPQEPDKRDYEHAIDDAKNVDDRATGLILFTNLKDSLGLLASLKQLNLTTHFQIFAAWGFSNYIEVTQGNEEVVEGSLSLEHGTEEIPKFREHFLALNSSSRTESEYKEFWEQTFGCKLGNTSDNAAAPKCTGGERLGPGRGYYPNTPVHFVINSMYSLAYAFRNFLEKHCSSNVLNSTSGNDFCEWQPQSKKQDNDKATSSIRHYLRHNSFPDHTLMFTDPITKQDEHFVKYEILNYAKTEDGYENKIKSNQIKSNHVKRAPFLTKKAHSCRNTFESFRVSK